MWQFLAENTFNHLVIIDERKVKLNQFTYNIPVYRPPLFLVEEERLDISANSYFNKLYKKLRGLGRMIISWIGTISYV